MDQKGCPKNSDLTCANFRAPWQTFCFEAISRASYGLNCTMITLLASWRTSFQAFFSTKWAGECLNLSVITGTNRDMIIETSQVSPCWARGQTFMENIKTAKLANNFFNFRRGLKIVLTLAPHPLKILSKFQWLPNGHIETTLNPEAQNCRCKQ